MTKVGTVTQRCLSFENQALLDPPQQGCTGSCRLLPQFDSKDIAVGQAPHLRGQRSQQLARQRRLPLLERASDEVEMGMCSAFHQGHHTHLREPTPFPPIAARPSEGGHILLTVGNVEHRAVQPNHPLAPIPSSVGLGRGHRTSDGIE